MSAPETQRIEPERPPTVGAFARPRARRFIRLHWTAVLRFLVTSIGRTACTVAVILLIRDFLSGVLGEPHWLMTQFLSSVDQVTALWVLVVLLLVVFVGGALLAYDNQVVMQRLVRAMELSLMEELIAHLLRLPVAFFDQRHRGDLLESVRQDVSKTRAAASASVEMFVHGATSLAYLGSAALISPRLLAFSAPVLVLAIAPSRWFARQMQRRSRGQRHHGYRLTELLLNLFHGVRIVKVYAGETAETENSVGRARTYFDELIASARLRALVDVVLETVGGLSVVVITVVGGFEVLHGRLSLPSLVAFLVAVRAAHGPLNNCYAQFMEIHRNWASIERLRDLLATTSPMSDRADAVRFNGPFESLRFERVSFAYSESTDVLTDVSFDVRAGQQVGIVGPSGAGKTTLINLVARFYDPTGGRILVNGRDLREYRLADYYRQLALVTQEPFVFGTTVRENIRYGSPGAPDSEVEAAARAAEIHDDIVALPAGYDTVLGVGGRLLSGGQIQRVNIARAFLKGAPIVLLDEATSSLDSISERRIQAALERLMHGRTTFTIAHRLSTLRSADLILVMDEGRCVAFGTHEALMRDCSLYRHLWETQRMGTERAVPLGLAAGRR